MQFSALTTDQPNDVSTGSTTGDRDRDSTPYNPLRVGSSDTTSTNGIPDSNGNVRFTNPTNVSTSTAKTAAANAVEKARSSGRSTTIVNIQNPNNINKSALQAMVEAVGGVTLNIQADRMNNGVLDMRIAFNPAYSNQNLAHLQSISKITFR